MNFNKTKIVKAVIPLIAIIMPLTAFSEPNERRFGVNAPFQIQDLPPSRLASKLEILPNEAKQKALIWMHSISFTEKDIQFMQVDNDGGILFADTYLPDENLASTLPGIDQVQAISPTDAFTLHSKPGAAKVMYLDFNGQTITGTAWNNSSGTPTFNAKAFSSDPDYVNFSPTELSQIAEIWHRVSEDFAPYDVDITTEDPLTFGPKVARLLITENVDANGNQMPYANAGGVAYVNVWGTSDFHTKYSPAFVYYNNLSFGYPPYIAEAASHEIGHNMGLSHDGTSSQSYYAGHGLNSVSWAPIMGVGYYQNITQWSRGEYALANQKQDDLYIMASKLTYRTDQVGNTISTALPLLADASGTILATNPETDPHNQNPNNKGIIETRADIDYFSFDTGAGPVNITVSPAWEAFYRNSTRGANLDIQIILYNSKGVLLLKSDPLDETDASISTTLARGHYYLAISGVGNTLTPYSDYGSLGQYFISGTLIPGVDATPPKPDPMTFSVAPYALGTTSISMTASTASDASGVVKYRFICSLAGNGCVSSQWQDSNTYTFTGLKSGTKYSFQTQAMDAASNMTTLSRPASATTVAVAPSIPANLTGTIYSTTRQLTWSPSTDARGYELFRCTVQPEGCLYGTSPFKTLTPTNYSFTNTSGISYRYKVRAINSFYKSDFSNEFMF